MSQNAPGKSHREGLTFMQVADMFRDEPNFYRCLESHRCKTCHKEGRKAAENSASAFSGPVEVDKTDKLTLQGFVVEHVQEQATVYTEEATAYAGLPFDHEAVKRSVREFVRGIVHTNGIESFWSMLKRAYFGTYHNMREMDTIDQMRHIVESMVGKRLKYAGLVV